MGDAHGGRQSADAAPDRGEVEQKSDLGAVRTGGGYEAEASKT
jgi:hypothetical protein